MKKHDYYFESFITLMDYGCNASELLVHICDNYGKKAISDYLNDMHKIEHDADLRRHEISKKLIKEFITPIDREDISGLINCIDDVTDAIEDVVRLLAIYNIKELRSDVKEFVGVIYDCCDSVRGALNELNNFRKSTLLNDCLVKINELEEKGDRIHFDALQALYAGNNEPLYVICWNNVYEALEKCCDQCERVSDIIESILMKNA